MGDIFWIIFLILCVALTVVSKIAKILEDKEKLKKIKKVTIVSNDSRKKVSSTIARGAVGGALLGPVGMVGGALSGKNKNTTTFLIEYINGNKETKIVDNESEEFKKLCNYIK